MELWARDGRLDREAARQIASLTEEEILETVNSRNLSGVFLREKDFSSLLGDVRRDRQGRILGAGAATLTWVHRSAGLACNAL